MKKSNQIKSNQIEEVAVATTEATAEAVATTEAVAEATTENTNIKRGKNGTLSVKQNYLIGFDGDVLKTPLAKKCKKHLTDAIAYNLNHDAIEFTMTNDDVKLMLEYLKEVLSVRDEDAIENGRQNQAFCALVALMQNNSLSYIKKIMVKSLSGAYNDDKLKKVKEASTEVEAVYELAEAGFSFVKFVKGCIRKILTLDGRYVIVYNSIDDAITYRIKDEAVEGVEE